MSGGLASFLSKLRSHHDPQRFEVHLRITLASFLAYCLSIADVPTIVPPSESFVVGLAGASMAIAVPQLMFTLGFAMPGMIVNIILALLGSSAILAAATESSGVSVVVFAVYTFWITSLYFGPDYDKTASNATALSSISGLLALSYRTLVQDGFSITIDEPPPSVSGALQLIADVLTALCVRQGQEPTCWEEALPQLTDPVELTIPDRFDMLGGQTAFVTPNVADSSLTIDIPGGLWIVKGLWTWSGTENSLAANQNLIIAYCWAIACVAVAIVLPPFRTARSALSQGLVPTAIKEASTKNNDDKDRDGDEAESQIRRLTHFYNVLKPSTASLTLFEPRLCKAPFEFTVPKLNELITCTRNAVFGKLTLSAWRRHVNISEVDEAYSVLSECAESLLSYDEDRLSRLAQMNDARVDSPRALTRDAVSYMHGKCDKLLDATVQWVDCQIHPDSPSPFRKEGFSNVRKTWLPWVLSPLVSLKRMMIAALLPFKPKSWDLFSMRRAWSLKYTTGLVALYVLTVYSEGYANLSLATGHSNLETGAVYSGWNLFGYAFSWTPTLEGTIKKGTQRLMGTCIGGFLGWLGVLICSGNDDSNINPYGLVAWLTFTTSILAWLAVEPSVAATLGMSKDHGAKFMYAVMTQAIIALETWAGKGSSADLTLNRVVATLTGVAMAMIVSSIPPVVKGGDPVHARLYLDALKDTFRPLLERLTREPIEVSINTEAVQTQLSVVAERQRASFFLLKDAAVLRRLPFFRVDERLRPLLEEMTVTESLVSQLVDVETAMFEIDASLTTEFTSDTVARRDIQKILQSLDDSGDTAEGTEESQGASSVGKDEAKPPSKVEKVFIPLITRISKRIQRHESVLRDLFDKRHERERDNSRLVSGSAP